MKAKLTGMLLAAVLAMPAIALAAEEEVPSGAEVSTENAGDGAMKGHAKRMRDLKEQIEQASDPEEQVKLKLKLLQSIGCGPS